MRVPRTLSLAAALLALIGVSPLLAQRPIELGIDGGFQVAFNGDAVWSFSVPFQQLRVGIMGSNRISYEPRVSFTHVQNGTSATLFVGGLHVLYRFGSSSGARLYGTVGANFLFADLGGNNNTDFTVGAGLGTRIPLIERLAVRLEGRYDRQFDAEVNSVSAIVGISFFTR